MLDYLLFFDYFNISCYVRITVCVEGFARSSFACHVRRYCRWDLRRRRKLRLVKGYREWHISIFKIPHYVDSDHVRDYHGMYICVQLFLSESLQKLFFPFLIFIVTSSRVVVKDDREIDGYVNKTWYFPSSKREREFEDEMW